MAFVGSMCNDRQQAGGGQGCRAAALKMSTQDWTAMEGITWTGASLALKAGCYKLRLGESPVGGGGGGGTHTFEAHRRCLHMCGSGNSETYQRCLPCCSADDKHTIMLAAQQGCGASQP